MEQYNIIIVQRPEESLINKFTTGQRVREVKVQ